MSVLQSGVNSWVDGYSRYSGTMSNSAVGSSNDTWGTPESDSFASVISDIEEEGEVQITHQEHEPDTSMIDALSAEIEAGRDQFSASNEIAAAVAAHIGIIEAAMRRHQATGTATFANDEPDGNQNPRNQSFENSMHSDMLQNPALAFAATRPSRDRSGILSLL